MDNMRSSVIERLREKQGIVKKTRIWPKWIRCYWEANWITDAQVIISITVMAAVSFWVPSIIVH